MRGARPRGGTQFQPIRAYCATSAPRAAARARSAVGNPNGTGTRRGAAGRLVRLDGLTNEPRAHALARRQEGRTADAEARPVRRPARAQGIEQALASLAVALDEKRTEGEREQAHLSALGQLGLVWRAVETVLDRNHNRLKRARRAA